MARFQLGSPALSATASVLHPGDRVALAMTNNPEYLAILFAIWRAGLVAVPSTPSCTPREIAYIVDELRGAALSRDRGHRRVARPTCCQEACGSSCLEIRIGVNLIAVDADGVIERRPEDLAWIFYTSGTTGKPKGAMLSHRNLLTMADRLPRRRRLR